MRQEVMLLFLVCKITASGQNRQKYISGLLGDLSRAIQLVENTIIIVHSFPVEICEYGSSFPNIVSIMFHEHLKGHNIYLVRKLFKNYIDRLLFESTK